MTAHPDTERLDALEWENARMLKALRRIRAASDYLGRERTSWPALTAMRRRVNRIACDAINRVEKAQEADDEDT